MTLTQEQKSQLEKYNAVKEEYIKAHSQWQNKEYEVSDRVSSCADRIITGPHDPILCRKGGFCHKCYLQNFLQENPEPQSPIYPRYLGLDPIPCSSYCSDCANRKKCKDIIQGIVWCPNKK